MGWNDAHFNELKIAKAPQKMEVQQRNGSGNNNGDAMQIDMSNASGKASAGNGSGEANQSTTLETKKAESNAMRRTRQQNAFCMEIAACKMKWAHVRVYKAIIHPPTHKNTMGEFKIHCIRVCSDMRHAGVDDAISNRQVKHGQLWGSFGTLGLKDAKLL